MTQRPNWDEHFMGLAEMASYMSTCSKLKVGAIAVVDKRPIATGFNGAPSGVRHCDSNTCLKVSQDTGCSDLCIGVHAEQNIIAQCAREGIKLKGATVYVTHRPCLLCLKMLINSGVSSIIYKYGGNDESTGFIYNQIDDKISLNQLKKRGEDQ